MRSESQSESGLPWDTELSLRMPGNCALQWNTQTGDRAGESLAKAASFSLHAGVATLVHQKNKFERVARYITPPHSGDRTALSHAPEPLRASTLGTRGSL